MAFTLPKGKALKSKVIKIFGCLLDFSLLVFNFNLENFKSVGLNFNLGVEI